MAYDFKREFRDLYQPKTVPALVDVPAMTFAAVAGAGDPNEEGGRLQARPRAPVRLLCLVK